MKNIYIFLSIFFVVSCSNKNRIFKDLNLNEKKIYLFFRGTETKEGIIAKKYNIINKDISHVGIGYFHKNENEFLIYHVINSNKDTNLEISSLNTFFIENDFKTVYCSIWEITNKQKTDRIISILNSYKEREIKFDLLFTGKNDNKLYCSEFIVNVLNEIDSVSFTFKKQKMKLKPLYSKILKKDTLYFYPADIFILNPFFKNICEKKIEYLN
jgi:hypothetical protein